MSRLFCTGFRVMIWAGGLALISGCSTAPLQQTRAFPATWPGSQPLGEDAPTVSVRPLKVLGEANLGDSAPGGIPSAAVLSALLVKHLHVNGMNAVLEPEHSSTAQYALNCTVPDLGYATQKGVMLHRRFRAEIACVLRDEATQTVVWERSLDRDYEESELLNFFTGLPEEPHEEERVLFRECIVPLWDATASTIRHVINAYGQISSQTPQS